VQRVADAPERHGLCGYLDNPRRTRANLLALTPKGRRMLERIESARRGWSESLGRRIGEPVLTEINVAVGKRPQAHLHLAQSWLPPPLPPAGLADWWALMQHHSAPTRLSAFHIASLGAINRGTSAFAAPD
jgi:hypothetical protein